MKPKDLGTAFEVRRGEVERQMKAGAQYFKVTGEIEVDGAGEAIVNVTFPVLFVDKPSFSYGHELGAGQPVIATQLPTGSLTVIQWGQRTRDDGTLIYSGATFAAVTSGPTTQVMNFQWHVEGVGLRGPTPTG